MPETFALLAEIHEKLKRELNRDGANDLCILAIMPGQQVPWDYVDPGMAWVRLIRTFPSATFPQGDASLENCTYTLAHEIEVGVLRPAPMADQRGNLPDEDEYLPVVQRQYADMEAMHRALIAADIELKVLGDYLPEGPMGGGVGGVWTATVGRDL